MEIITLIDNERDHEGLACEHGLSFYIKIDDLTILFDLGQSDKLLKNAMTLGLNLADVDVVVLSHGHYDHTGGLPAFFELNKKATVFVHYKAFEERYSRSANMQKYNGLPWRNRQAEWKHRLVLIDKDYQVADGVFIVSEFEKGFKHRIPDERLVTLDTDGVLQPDTFEDELVLVLKEKHKTAVLSGCAHNGIASVLEYLSEKFKCEAFDLVAGGLHLSGKDSDVLHLEIEKLKQFAVAHWAVNHCTGTDAILAMKLALNQSVVSHAVAGFSWQV